MNWQWPFQGRSSRRQLDLVLAVANDVQSARLPDILGQTATRIRDYYQAGYACIHPSQDAHVISVDDMPSAFPWCPCAHGPAEEAAANMAAESRFFLRACEDRAPLTLSTYLHQNTAPLAAFMEQMRVREAFSIPLFYQGEDFAAVQIYFDRPQKLRLLDAEYLRALGNMVGTALQRELKRLADEDYDDVIQAFGQVIEAKDGYTSRHVSRVTDLAVRLAEALQMNRAEIRQLRRAASLHDIGKVAVPDHVLGKSGPLDADDWVQMRRHPSIGADIPLQTRIVAICDGFDAMISDRPYRRGMPVAKAVQILRDGAKTQWDAALVELFITQVIPQDATLQQPAIAR